MPSNDPVIETASGSVRGTSEGSLAVFKGIPFAEAPFGEHRFQAPVPRSRWEGVREATEFGPPPPQTARLLGGAPRPPGLPEDPAPDCLTVNIWTPDSAASLPVLVWIYGGGYLAGSARQPVYDGATLAADGVIVVTLNYRLGVDGFAALSGAPANRGLLDQVAALSWVQENISAFGGDPSNVTIFGESAGGGSIAALLAMPSARGLYRRAILQSVPGTYFAPSLANDVTMRIAAELGIDASAAGFSTRTPEECGEGAAQLHAKMTDLVDTWGRVARTVTPFSPVVDGEVLPVSPWTALRQGAARDVELIIGWMHDEYRVFHVMDGTLERDDPEESRFMVDLLGPGSGAHDAYAAAYPQKSEGELIEVAFSDWLFRMAGRRLAENQVEGGGRAHVYEVCIAAPVLGGAFGACHGFDVPLTFGNLSGDPMVDRYMGEGAPSDAIRRVSREIRDAWLSFANSGDPGWPAFDVDRAPARVFDRNSETVAPIEPVSAALWRDHHFDSIDLLA